MAAVPSGIEPHECHFLPVASVRRAPPTGQHTGSIRSVPIHLLAVLVGSFPLDRFPQHHIHGLLALSDSALNVLDLVERAKPAALLAPLGGEDLQEDLVDAPVLFASAKRRGEAKTIGIVGSWLTPR